MAARNSLKTGIYAATLVLPDESEQEFLELRDALLIELGASGVLESALVHDLAVVTWKKARLDRIEHRVVMQRLNASATSEDYFEGGLERTPEHEWVLLHLNWLTPKLSEEISLREALARQLMSEQDRVTAIAGIQEQLPDLFEQIEAWVRDESDKELSNNVDFISLHRARQYAVEKGTYIPVIRLLAVGLGYKILEECKRFKLAFDVLPQLDTIREQIRDQRLANLMAAEGPSRAREDLNRSFFRVLKELRTQQAWRKMHEVIDVTPNNSFSKTD